MNHVIHYQNIPWYGSPVGGPLGRNVVHDSRNLAYRVQRTAPVLVTRLHTRNIPIHDQGSVGSCTGNAQVGVMGSSPTWETLADMLAIPFFAGGLVLDEQLALDIYSVASVIDGHGPYPPNDYGSSGPSAAKAAMKLGLINGYTHCLSLDDVLWALQTQAVAIGVNWYSSFDQPDSTGELKVTRGAGVRGGHEVMLRGIDVEDKTVYGDNSWGDSWGVDGGSFRMSWGTLDRLLHEDGDGTVSIPLNKPAPVPVPPVPVPVPADHDRALWEMLRPWALARHRCANRKAALAVQAWAELKGFS